MLKFPIIKIRRCPFCGKATLEHLPKGRRCRNCLKYLNSESDFWNLPEEDLKLLFCFIKKTLHVDVSHPDVNCDYDNGRHIVYASNVENLKILIEQELEERKSAAYEQMDKLCKSIWEEDYVEE